ncbi:uncharacterized protein STEHIDRAFT_164066 [Stereum hirsutum FP-91666 SS1]|uniref:Uncharacterized protein n=1 Tax=Stereum hirsutum (strain FP-91666) TaxID=721885 RepID=R7RWC1_STEHR|nr:uncharacterized protein STEHIDRAFT_164066 [Stereum hirsutum FP-91666 SS1]EIM79043.1 hypothetical protein STEHIDRAFT_164066 [Stereum hirsutum FP-91666 SS1]
MTGGMCAISRPPGTKSIGAVIVENDNDPWGKRWRLMSPQAMRQHIGGRKALELRYAARCVAKGDTGGPVNRCCSLPGSCVLEYRPWRYETA